MCEKEIMDWKKNFKKFTERDLSDLSYKDPELVSLVKRHMEVYFHQSIGHDVDRMNEFNFEDAYSWAQELAEDILKYGTGDFFSFSSLVPLVRSSIISLTRHHERAEEKLPYAKFEYTNFSQLKKDLKKLDEEFHLARLGPIIEILEPSGLYLYDVNLNIEQESSYGKKSCITLQGRGTYGYNDPYRYEFKMVWTTASGHTVSAEGVIRDNKTDDGYFSITLGEDYSTSFYPLVVDILEGE